MCVREHTEVSNTLQQVLEAFSAAANLGNEACFSFQHFIRRRSFMTHIALSLFYSRKVKGL